MKKVCGNMSNRHQNGKGDRRRKGNIRKYEATYIRLFNPICGNCGRAIVERVGWFGKYLCINKNCRLYNKVIERK